MYCFLAPLSTKSSNCHIRGKILHTLCMLATRNEVIATFNLEYLFTSVSNSIKCCKEGPDRDNSTFCLNTTPWEDSIPMFYHVNEINQRRTTSLLPYQHSMNSEGGV